MSRSKKVYFFLIISFFMFNTCFFFQFDEKSQIKKIKKELTFHGSCLVKGEVCDEYYGEYTRLKVIQLCTETQSMYSTRYCVKTKVILTCIDSNDYSAAISFYYKDYSGKEGKEKFCKTKKTKK